MKEGRKGENMKLWKGMRELERRKSRWADRGEKLGRWVNRMARSKQEGREVGATPPPHDFTLCGHL